MSTLQRKSAMNPGKGFQSRGAGFQRNRRDDVEISEEVGEGEGSTFGYSKRMQARASVALNDEVGEGVSRSFGISKKSQTRSAGKAPAARQGGEVGEGVVRQFGRKVRAITEGYQADRVRKMPTIDDPSRFKWGEEVGEGLVSMPKPEAKRNAALLEMARGRGCLLQAPYTAGHDPATTVACHGNSHKFGKAKGRKSDDCYSVWGCFECHSWLDQSSATAEEKERVFHLGMFRQMLAWEQIAASDVEPQRHRKAAEWALDALQAAEYSPQAELLALM